MEGAGVYRMAPFEALERAEIEAILVHARQVKPLKGRKADVSDSVWLACVCQFGLCTPSHAPPRPFREKIAGQMPPWEAQLRLPTTIPGIDRNAASTILIEIGPDIGVFGYKERLVAWAGLCPDNNESGASTARRARIGSRTLRATLVKCAHGAARTKSCQFEAHHRALAARHGYKCAVVASAHKQDRDPGLAHIGSSPRIRWTAATMAGVHW